MKLENLFIIVAFLFGLAFALVTPPFQSPDEYNHFFRAYALSKGDLYPSKVKVTATYRRINLSGWDNEGSGYLVGSYVPLEIVELMNQVNNDLPGKTSKKQNLGTLFKSLGTSTPKSGITTFANYPNTALYSPVPYIPAVAGVKLSELLGLNYLYAMYFARFMYLAVYILMIYYSIKLAPYLKITLYLLGLMPMSLFLGSSISVDGVVIGLAFLTYSLVVSLYNSYSNKLYISLILVSVLLGLSKSAYFVLPFFSFLLIYVKSVTQYYKIVLPGLFSTLAFGIWSLLTASMYVPLLGGVDPAVQVNVFLANPFTYFKTLYITISGMRMYLVNQFVGNFGWLDTPMNVWVCVTYVAILVFSVFIGSERIKVLHRALLAIITVCAVTIVSLFIYASWSPVGFPEVQGLVGRYFIPISIFGLATIQFPIRKFNTKYVVGLLFLSNVGLLIYSVYTIILRYYIA